MEILSDAKLEPALTDVPPGESVQFEQVGCFCADSKDSTPERPALNRTVSLRDSWAKTAPK